MAGPPGLTVPKAHVPARVAPSPERMNVRPEGSGRSTGFPMRRAPHPAAGDPRAEPSSGTEIVS